MRVWRIENSLSGAIALVVGFSVAPGIAAQMHWVYAAAYPDTTSGDCDVVLDAQDRVHIVYGSDALHYDWEEADGWHSEVADAAAAPASHDLVLDSAGFPHVTYVDRMTYHVKYARRDAEGWAVETIAQDAYDLWSVLCLDSADRPHVGYNAGARDSGVERRLVHVGKDASGWQATTVGSWNPTHFRLEGLAIGVDGGNEPHLACVTWKDGMRSVVHAWRTASGWESAETSVIGDAIKLQIDGMGRVHVVYYAEGTGWEGVTYILGRLHRFDAEQLLATTWWVDPQLGISAEGVPHVVAVVFSGLPSHGLYHLSKPERDWNQTLVDPQFAGYPPGLALDAVGRPHVYHGGRYAWQDGEGWHTRDEPSGPDDAGSLVVTRDNQLCLAQEKALYRRDPAGWHERVIAQAPIDAESARLVLDAQNQPHLVFFESFTGSRYLWRDAEGWHARSFEDSIGCDLALDSGGHTHIAYLHVNQYGSPSISEHLKYAVLRDTGWEVTVVETNQWATPSLVLDDFDQPHILASESDTGGTVHFWEDPGGWHRETVPLPGGGSGELAVDRAGYLHTCGAASAGANRFSIWHGLRTTQGWQFDVVSTSACEFVGGTSLALDELDRPHIAYATLNINRPGPNRLVYARQDATGWQVETVQSTGSDLKPLYPCLGVSPEGVPSFVYVAYRGSDATSEFQYVERSALGWQTITLETGFPNTRSLVMDLHGRPHLVYCNRYGRHNLAYQYAPPFNLTGLTPLADGRVHIDWQGVLEEVGVDCAASLSGGWSPVAEDLDGLHAEIDVDPTMRFFRLRQAGVP